MVPKKKGKPICPSDLLTVSSLASFSPVFASFSCYGSSFSKGTKPKGSLLKSPSPFNTIQRAGSVKHCLICPSTCPLICKLLPSALNCLPLVQQMAIYGTDNYNIPAISAGSVSRRAVNNLGSTVIPWKIFDCGVTGLRTIRRLHERSIWLWKALVHLWHRVVGAKPCPPAHPPATISSYRTTVAEAANGLELIVEHLGRYLWFRFAVAVRGIGWKTE